MAKKGKGLFGFVTGLVVGAAAVFLSKKENRSKVVKTAKKTAKTAKRTASKVKKVTKKTASKLKSKKR